MNNLYAWSMKDGDFKHTKLTIYFLLVEKYFAIGTKWPDEEPTWLTRQFETPRVAHAYAIHHTGLLEKGGDTMEHGPVVTKFLIEIVPDFEELVGKDQVSARLDHLFDEAMVNGIVGEVIP